MRKLNRRARQQIFETLEASPFTAADFDISFPDEKENGSLASISFIPEPAYSLSLREPDSRGKFVLEYVPGSWMQEANADAESFSECLKVIGTWCSNVRADLRANSPWAAELDDLRSSFDEAIRNHVDNPDAHFTREEATQLQTRLDEVAAKFDALHERNAVTEEQLKLVRAELEEIKKNAAFFTKRTFFKTAGNKLFSLMMKVAGSKPAQEVLTEVTRHALGYGDPPRQNS